ncbi:hypothetical protein [Streptomyces sp. NPDC097981]|uniref:hypothetical protein n=1 Tax=Streptomyces sp. NPDC097981 TaxID=3155428 RepID=UPI00332E5B20
MLATIQWGTSLSQTTTWPPAAMARRAVVQARVWSASIAVMSDWLGLSPSVAMR